MSEIVQQGTSIVPMRSSDQVDMARSLIREYVASIGVDLTTQGGVEEGEGDLSRYTPPNGEMLLAVDPAGKALGCVAMHDVGEGDVEIKRLFVRPTARGTGTGHALLRGIVDAARMRGFERAVLDTLPRLEAAIATYRAAGFVEIPAYWANPLANSRSAPLPIVYFGLALQDGGDVQRTST